MSTTGQTIDKLIALRDRRLRAQKKVDDLRQEELAIADTLVDKLRDEKLDRASGKKGTFSIKTVAVGKVEDWDALYKWIKRTGEFEMLEKRFNHGPLRERLEDGKKAPAGVKVERVTKTHLHKNR